MARVRYAEYLEYENGFFFWWSAVWKNAEGYPNANFINHFWNASIKTVLANLKFETKSLDIEIKHVSWFTFFGIHNNFEYILIKINFVEVQEKHN